MKLYLCIIVLLACFLSSSLLEFSTSGLQAATSQKLVNKSVNYLNKEGV